MWYYPNNITELSARNLAVLIPYSQGVWIYSRSDGGPLSYAMDSPASQVLSEVVDFVSQLPEPRLATWLGVGPWTVLGQLLEREIELCVIPDRWVKHIPDYQRDEQAQFTVQLTEAFLQNPIKIFGRLDRPEWRPVNEGAIHTS